MVARCVSGSGVDNQFSSAQANFISIVQLPVHLNRLPGETIAILKIVSAAAFNHRPVRRAHVQFGSGGLFDYSHSADVIVMSVQANEYLYLVRVKTELLDVGQDLRRGLSRAAVQQNQARR